MAELLTLSNLAIQASVALVQTIRSVRHHPVYVRHLLSDLSSLAEILRNIAATIESIKDIDLSALETLLRQCRGACEDFEQAIVERSTRSADGRRSIRDWAKLRCMGEDIHYFQQQISNYKSVLNLALMDTKLQVFLPLYVLKETHLTFYPRIRRQSSRTAKSIENFKDLVSTTAEDLQDHLRSIDEKLESIIGRTLTASDSDSQELCRIKEDRLATQKCIEVCANLANHIDQLMLVPRGRSSSRSSSSTTSDVPEGMPEKITNEGLQECKSILLAKLALLEKEKEKVIDRLIQKSKVAATSAEDVADLSRLEEELQTTRQYIGICTKAENNVQKNISIIDNYGTGDSVLFSVSTNGQPINCRNRGMGHKNRMVGGYLSDASIQQISRDFSTSSIQNFGRETTSPEENSITASRNISGKEPDSHLSRREPDFGLTTSESAADSAEPAEDMTESSTTSTESGACTPLKHNPDDAEVEKRV